jgi:hypothetical protein
MACGGGAVGEAQNAGNARAKMAAMLMLPRRLRRGGRCLHGRHGHGRRCECDGDADARGMFGAKRTARQGNGRSGG